MTHIYISLPEEMRSHAVYTALLYTVNIFVIYFYSYFYGYYFSHIALLQLNLVLQVQHIHNPLNELLFSKFNSTNATYRQYHTPQFL
jgi:hypothetical protein